MKTVIVLPAFNAAETLEKTIRDIPKHSYEQIILVDDFSRDHTVKLAKKMGLKVFTHPCNRGYGANQKTCYTLALSEGADIIVMLHPDYQYDSSLIPQLIEPIQKGKYQVMLGSRIRTRKETIDGGMPLYKYVGNRLLTFIENLVLGQNLSEYHTGFRAFDRDTLKTLAFHKYSDSFVFDQQIIFGALAKKAKIGEIPVPVRYFKEASSINFLSSCQYGISTIYYLFVHLLRMD